MLSVNTILIPVLGGFLFVKYSYLTRFRSIRDNGYVILFKSAIVGLFFMEFLLFFGEPLFLIKMRILQFPSGFTFFMTI